MTWNSSSMLNLLNTLRRLGLVDRVPKDLLKRKSATENGGDQIQSYIDRAMRE